MCQKFNVAALPEKLTARIWVTVPKNPDPPKALPYICRLSIKNISLFNRMKSRTVILAMSVLKQPGPGLI